MIFRISLCHSWILTVILVSLVAGCSKSSRELERYELSGTITYDGKAVPAGRIQFVPDTAKGNQGAAGYAVIHNGTYDTSRNGKGTVGGPHRVMISGLVQTNQGPVESDEELADLSLFPNYWTTVDLPKTNGKQNFEVPVNAK